MERPTARSSGTRPRLLYAQQLDGYQYVAFYPAQAKHVEEIFQLVLQRGVSGLGRCPSRE
jgi:hypothetical protein